jgi:hypothetical protein
MDYEPLTMDFFIFTKPEDFYKLCALINTIAAIPFAG